MHEGRHPDDGRAAANATTGADHEPDASVEQRVDTQAELPLFGPEKANVDDWWMGLAQKAIRHLAEGGTEFDAYDLTLIGVPDPADPHYWGSAFNAAAKAGLIEPVSYRRSRRNGGTGGLSRTWRGVGR